jgi:predicted helicase
VLHHDGYRQRFADNLKRELPRIPLVSTPGDFRAFRDAGKELLNLHVDYEALEPWPLSWKESKKEPLSYRVEKMRLSKDKKSIVINDSLTLSNIPPGTHNYRLGNRSALEWVIDQYRERRDKKGQVFDDPNSADEPEYILRLVGQVVRVSVETVKIVSELPKDIVE